MNSQESFRCVPQDMGYCRCVGDPHCTTFDGMQHDVYGLGMYQAAANFGQGVPEFQWAFDTYEFARTGHAAIDKYAFEIQFKIRKFFLKFLSKVLKIGISIKGGIYILLFTK